MASKRSPAKQAELKANYAKLREAGYSPKDAARLRSTSASTLKQALSTSPRAYRQARPISQKHAKAGGGSGKRYEKKDSYRKAPPLEYPPHKGRLKASDYIEITPDSDRKFANQYAYAMTYIVVDKDGIEQRKYFTILPDGKMTKKQMKDFVWQFTGSENTRSKYPEKAIKSSIQLIAAYHNADYD